MSQFVNETAETVYYRTYSRELPDGSKETWPQTVQRVVDGNLSLVADRFIEDGERERLIDLIQNFKIMPAGRHLKSSGVNDYANNNCWSAGWIPGDPAEHFRFTLLRLAEGGGVGANYSSRYFQNYPYIVTPVTVHIVCDPEHPDYLDLAAAGLISTDYSHTWAGAYEVADSREGWAAALGDLIETAHRAAKNTNRVYDVSRVRHKGAALKKFGGTASGPEPFAQMLVHVGKILSRDVKLSGKPMTGLQAMEIDHEIAQCIVSGGVRRSARMSIMHWNDYDIFEFINSKKDMSKHWTTNISVEIDDEFVNIIRNGEEKTLRQAKAQAVYLAMCKGMLENGEPGFWDSSLSAAGEPDGTYTTNPCAEITLNPWEPCCLGHVNLSAYVEDWDGMLEAHRLMTRYLIRATHSGVKDGKSQDIINKNRRIGVGHFGVADFLAMSGIDYRHADSLGFDVTLMDLKEEVEKSAKAYCHELRIPMPVKMTTIAPTGSISKLCGVSGEGIHAPFSKHFIRRIRFSDVDPHESRQVEEYKAKGHQVEPCMYAANTSVVEIPTKDPLMDKAPYPQLVVSQQDLAVEEMLAFQEMYQEHWADNAVSYTVNIDPERYGLDDFMNVLSGHLGHLKGSTIFPALSRDQAPYEPITGDEYNQLVSELGESVESGFDEECASGACPI
ncbi:ribonucleoside-triphosphate reductase, adenosylcobalamin-dependent [Streptomyces sp. WZ-12]|uniref:ribonucleoside-triphosphate reductase, adenosylcobalamin-dependent n=1 Tax=Streptomyces sp. WZ-12 TaxID=3030210 RepID=UPI00238165CD|nr:ribonucleoside-triphosphate reductase, adenosylcobalamin-dependent [Streptomyces sp. WZ-12]